MIFQSLFFLSGFPWERIMIFQSLLPIRIFFRKDNDMPELVSLAAVIWERKNYDIPELVFLAGVIWEKQLWYSRACFLSRSYLRKTIMIFQNLFPIRIYLRKDYNISELVSLAGVIWEKNYDIPELASYQNFFEKGLWYSGACCQSGFHWERIIIFQSLLPIRISLRKDYDIPELVSNHDLFEKWLWYSTTYAS